MRQVKDASFFGSKGSSGSSLDAVMPTGVKVKKISEVEGAGSLASYPDTEEMVSAGQRANISKIKSQSVKRS